MSLRRALLTFAGLFIAAPTFAATVFVDLPVGATVFAPRSIAINAGDTVTWRNPAGGGFHGVLSDDNTSFVFLPAAAPWTYSATFAVPGVYPYHCQIHGAAGGVGMSGVVFVGRAPRPATEHILQLNAWDFQPIEGAAAIFTGGVNLYSRRASTGGPSGFAELIAGVHLRTGSIVTAVELTACDTDATATFDAHAALSRCTEPNGPCLGTSEAATSGAPGCGFFTGLPGETIDNLGNAYFVRVLLPVSANVSFRTVRLYYTEPVSYGPAVATFSDVPATHPFFRYIEALAASGITAGCAATPPQYCPDAPLTRGQMAVFLARALGLFWPN